MSINFLDTSSLLVQIPNEFFVISEITLEELENIKTSASKDTEIKQKARKIARFIMENFDKNRFAIEKCHIDDKNMSNDKKILACAQALARRHPDEELIFYTNDINMYNMARAAANISKVQEMKEITETYKGYREVTLSDEEMAQYYSNLTSNFFNLYKGEYLIIKNSEGEVVDTACWNGTTMRGLTYDEFTSTTFGRLKPKKDDPYQACVFDSLDHNQVTLITGPAGSGKSLIGLGYLFSLLDKKIDRIVVFCNPVVVRNAAKIGFVPGDVNQKLLTTQMGNILSSKIGDKIAVETLIDQQKLILVPVGDCRGYEVPPNSGVFITEGQNFNIDLLRLILQRCGEDTKIIVEGDVLEQVDLESYAGERSGINSMSKVFRGKEVFGQVELQNIYRSQVAKLADKMR